GQPRDGDPRASCMVLDSAAGTATWERVPYDFEAVGTAMRAAGLPPRLADRLRVGALRPAMIGGRRPLQGRKPGDRRVRVERPHAPYFRYTGPGHLTAKEAASAPTTASGRIWANIRGLFVGKPLASDEEIGERLSKTKALAIFSSDAISSSAYATEEILRVLILGGVAALAFGLEISIAISVLLVAVAISYRQICI